MSCEIYLQFLAHISLGTSGFPRVRREFSLSAKALHIFGRRPKPRAAKRVTIKTWHKDLTETGNRARKVSAAQGRPTSPRSTIYLFILLSSFFEPILDPRFSIPILDPRPWLSSKLRSFTHYDYSFFLDHLSNHLLQSNERFQAIEFVDRPVPEKPDGISMCWNGGCTLSPW